jgi:DNA polymerase III delta prime subunit
VISQRQLLSEVLRPQHLGDLALPQQDIDRLQHMLESREIMNMLFHGAPGTGKTSAARIFGAHEGIEFIEFNGSDAGKELVLDTITGFASSMSFKSGAIKIAFIDEADDMRAPAQKALRKVIEDYSAKAHVRFILASNDPDKIIDALGSRLFAISFYLPQDERHEVLQRIIERYKRVLPDAGITYDERRLLEIVNDHYPDFRVIANKLEYEFACR